MKVVLSIIAVLALILMVMIPTCGYSQASLTLSSEASIETNQFDQLDSYSKGFYGELALINKQFIGGVGSGFTKSDSGSYIPIVVDGRYLFASSIYLGLETGVILELIPGQERASVLYTLMPKIGFNIPLGENLHGLLDVGGRLVEDKLYVVARFGLNVKP